MCRHRVGESYTAPIMLFIALGLLSWIIMNWRRCSLFGVNGTAPMEIGAGAAIMYSAIITAVKLFDNDDGEGSFVVVRDGMLTTRFVGLVTIGIIVASMVLIIVFARKHSHDVQQNKP